MTERCRETPSSQQSLSPDELCFCRWHLASQKQHWSHLSSICCGTTAYVLLLASLMSSESNLFLKSCSTTHPCLPRSLKVSLMSKCSTKGLHLPPSPRRQAPGLHKNQSHDRWPSALQWADFFTNTKPEPYCVALAGRAQDCPMDSSGDRSYPHAYLCT